MIEYLDPEQVVEPYEIGKWYRVPCVHGRMWKVTGWWPVMGPKHDDAEIVGFKWVHYHIDWRFVSARWFAFACSGHRGEAQALAWVLQERGNEHDNIWGPINEAGLAKPTLRRLKCKRSLPAYPLEAATWLPKLEAAMKGCRLREGMVCPHRGLPLSSLPQRKGIVTCPGHGLSWYVRTGELVPNEAVRKLL